MAFAGEGFGNIGQKSSSVVACYEEQKPFLQAYFGDCAKFAIVNTKKMESILSIGKRDLISDG